LTYQFRLFKPADSLQQLTDLLYQAYAEHAAAGRRFFASYQTPADTQRRIAKGECWLAFDDQGLVGTVTVVAPYTFPSGYPAGPDAGTFYQLAVLPAHQRRGLGDSLLRLAEKRILEAGVPTAVIDTSDQAATLIAWYEKRGYSVHGRWRWEVTNYESIVLAKSLAPK
jgi:ribosomal protein S18 acetylase RimI-like enzyme